MAVHAQKLFPHQLLGAYNGEVLVQKEYDDSLEYDFTLGDNVRDDKTFTLWSPEDQGTLPLAIASCSFSPYTPNHSKGCGRGSIPSQHCARTLHMVQHLDG